MMPLSSRTGRRDDPLHQKVENAAFIASLVIQGMVLVLSPYNRGYAAIRELFEWQFHIFLALCIGATVLMWVDRRVPVRLVYVAGKIGLVFLIGYPMGRDLDLEALLFFSVVVEASIYFRPTIAAPAGGILVLFFAFTQRDHSSWWSPVPSASLSNVAVVTAAAVLISAASVTLNGILRICQIHRARIAHLDAVITRLSDANIGFQSYVRTLELQVLSEERKRVSREIHDTVGYALTNVIMMIEAAILTTDREKRNETLKMAQVQTQRGLAETRAALRHIRDEKIPESHGVSMIHELVCAFRDATGIEIELEFGNLPNRVSSDIDAVIFRFIQEGLTNAFRHGMASKIRILFWVSEGLIHVSVYDNGVGATQITEGIGFAGMRERLETIGGTLSIETMEIGFKVNAEIPLNGEKGSAE